MSKLQISKTDMNQLVKRAQSLQSRAKTAMEKADQYVETGIRTAIVGMTAFGFGVAQGKWGGIELLGIPAELLTAVGGHIAAFAGVGGKATAMLHHVADGAFAAWTNNMGFGIGKSWHKGAPGAATKGDVIPDDEMNRINRDV